MEITILTNVTHEDLPQVQRILGDLGIGGSVVQSAPQSAPPATVPVASVPTPSVPSVSTPSGSDAAAKARQYGAFYRNVGDAIGRPLAKHEKSQVKQAFPNVAAGAALLGTQAPQAATPQADDDDDTLQQQFAAFLAARQGVVAQQSPQVAPQAPSGRKLTTMPESAAALSDDQRTALRAWTANFVAKPRIEAVLAYVEGQLPWAACEAVGVKASKALRQVNA